MDERVLAAALRFELRRHGGRNGAGVSEQLAVASLHRAELSAGPAARTDTRDATTPHQQGGSPMDEHLDGITMDLANGADAGVAAHLSSGERCYVALAARRYELLPPAHDDPVEAWYRLSPEGRAAVCRARGWPLAWAEGAGALSSG